MHYVLLNMPVEMNVSFHIDMQPQWREIHAIEQRHVGVSRNSLGAKNCSGILVVACAKGDAGICAGAIAVKQVKTPYTARLRENLTPVELVHIIDTYQQLVE